jgi:protein-L-isoaspartate(D-aspartate) O-methyltransferase
VEDEMTEKIERTDTGASLRAAASIEAMRRFFAEEVGAVAHLEDRSIVDAFARVPREAFLGPGPWQIVRAFDVESPYRWSADGDPRHIYHDVGVAIDASRQLNSGQPSALARWIEAAAIRPGESILHIGCGLGYYTAILAELVGAGGRLLACEVDADLAARAAQHLAGWTHVTVELGDGSAPDGSFDVIVVNAGATRARREWLSALGPAGRMLLPLTVHLPGMPLGLGVMLRIDRGERDWPARFLTQVGIYDCATAREPADEAELMKLGEPGVLSRLRAAAMEPHERGPDCLVHLDGFCLQA